MSSKETTAFENAFARVYSRSFTPRCDHFNRTVWAYRVATRYVALCAKAGVL